MESLNHCHISLFYFLHSQHLPESAVILLVYSSLYCFFCLPMDHLQLLYKPLEGTWSICLVTAAHSWPDCLCTAGIHWASPPTVLLGSRHIRALEMMMLDLWQVPKGNSVTFTSTAKKQQCSLFGMKGYQTICTHRMGKSLIFQFSFYLERQKIMSLLWEGLFIREIST